jgi:hypothetical protein
VAVGAGQEAPREATALRTQQTHQLTDGWATCCTALLCFQHLPLRSWPAETSSKYMY